MFLVVLLILFSTLKKQNVKIESRNNFTQFITDSFGQKPPQNSFLNPKKNI